MSDAVQGHPRQTGHTEEFWQNMVHWRRKWQPKPVFLSGKPHEQYKKAKGKNTGKMDTAPSKSERVQHAMREEQRAITNSSKKNEAAGPKQKCCLVLDVSGGESKVQRYKEQ